MSNEDITTAKSARAGSERVDHLQLMLDESRDLGEFLADLPEEQWDTPSLCRGWRVRDVVSHMAVGHTMPIFRYGIALSRYRLRMDDTSFALATDYARTHTPAEILALFREGTAGRPRAAARLVPVRDLFTDHLVHQQDIRRPLGMPREIPQQRALAALQTLARMRTVPCRRRMAGLHLIATDVDFERRAGELELRGTAEALIMAVTGRVNVLSELRGDGVDTLAHRLKDRRAQTSH